VNDMQGLQTKALNPSCIRVRKTEEGDTWPETSARNGGITGQRAKTPGTRIKNS